MKYLLALSFAFLFSQDTPSVEIYRRPIEQRVIVPNVVGLEFTRAVDTLIRLGLSVTEPIPSVSDYPVDRVIGQEPSRGSVVPVETEIRLTISTGPRKVDPETVIVPSVLGRRIEQAEAILHEAGLNLGRITPVESLEEPGRIQEQEPVAGKRVPRDSSVDVTVTTRESRQYVLVPQVVGESLKQAKKTLENARLRTGEINPQVTDEAGAIVIEQTPRPGMRVRVDAPVDLVVESRKARPFTLPWIVGGLFIALGLGGYIVVRHLVKSRKMIDPTRSPIRLVPEKDIGNQDIDSKDNLQSDFEICLVPFTDMGIQIVEVQGNLVKEEQAKND